MAALSYTRAASSAVSKVPSQTRTPRQGSRISAANLPHGLRLTPRNLVLGAPAPPFVNLLRPAEHPPTTLLPSSPSPPLHCSGKGAAAAGAGAKPACTTGAGAGGSSRTMLPTLRPPHPSSSPDESVKSGSSQKIRTVRERDMARTKMM
uniref:Uncharacterized protein n=1 Tax=Oryza brachyantha TaxID=4533 RepID=J3L2I7_ORYBR